MSPRICVNLLLLAVFLAFSAACKQAENPPAWTDGATVSLYRDPVTLADFKVTDLEGKTLTSADLKGKVVFMNFWATWCPPCRAEIPDLVALQQKYKDQIVVVGISEDEIAPDQVKAFAAQYAVNYPIAMNTPELRKIFKGIVALPTTFVIDRDGKLVQKHVGQLNPAMTELEARVLAGIDTNVKIERVESSDKVRLANAAEAKTIPGVDLSKFNETERKAAVKALIESDCTCGCGLTVAECRLDDPQCPVSLPLAKEIVAKFGPH
jgi:thiol-disulfide isomerase/thioredoxin